VLHEKDTSNGSLNTVKTFEHPAKIPHESRKRAAAILWNLHLQGPVEDPKGAAIEMLRDRLAEVGWSMPKVSVGRIVDGFGDRGGQYGDIYPYNYIAREISGKRTLSIKLIVDPERVPFPPNPFGNWPAFHPVPVGRKKKGERERFSDPGPAPAVESEETFARQRQFDEVVAAVEPPAPPAPVTPVVVADPEPEEIDELDEITDIPDATVGTLEPYRAEPTVRTNGADQGDDFELVDLPADLLTDIEEESSQPRSAMDMVSAAISLLSDAMAAHAGEQMHLAADTLDRHIDARLGEYRVLQERLERSEGKLRHTVAQYERVVEIARAQRKQLVALQRELARLRPKSSVPS
jgi:hypothetical protein